MPPCAATPSVGKLVGAGGLGTLHVACTLSSVMGYMTCVHVQYDPKCSDYEGNCSCVMITRV